jgi:precorrin-8X/cobalt-precorrin-8 methylmutase
MELHITDAQSLASIDREIDSHQFSPAEYEIVRQVIYSTADFEYASVLNFSEQSIKAGAAALAARTPIVVDVPMIQVSIVPLLQKTFINPVYCCTTTAARSTSQTTKAGLGLPILAKRCPEAIFVIGQAQTALTALIEAIEKKIAQPSLIISTPSLFVDLEIKEKLKSLNIPYICTDSRKGSPVVATSIFNALVNLSWQVYGQNLSNIAIRS